MSKLIQNVQLKKMVGNKNSFQMKSLFGAEA